MSKSSQILIVDDDAELREAISDTLMLTGYSCIGAGSAEQALQILAKRHVDMVISDIQMGRMNGHELLNSINEKYPGLPVLLMTAYANIDGAVRAMRDGAIDYLAKPFAPEVLLNQVSRYVPVNKVTKKEPVWADPSTGELLQLAKKVAKSDATVMITGPSGSGKEILSRYVHDNSNRSEGPFVAINCAAIPDTMLESTLFGYEKGAFTGAVQACPGKFEQANGGTILLDEITEMDLSLQAKLLRVLQEREVERLGSRKTISLDVRVIATSNRDLKQAVAEHKFREDLYYRLNVFPLKWRPLCKRPRDIIPLAKFFLEKHAQDQQLPIPALSEAAQLRLMNYSWPGNVRELDNVMQRALILSGGTEVDEASLILDENLDDESFAAGIDGIVPAVSQEQLMEQGKSDSAEAAVLYPESDSLSGLSESERMLRSQKIPQNLGGELKQQEYQIILDALIEYRGNRQMVSQKLGISPRTLRYKIAKMREEGMIIPG
ncbi:MAG: sigma-54-dependent Fis family transcriptional regulator [Proteobacteria bacterium]|uniref:Sigma-54-dependent Fis family transcriptional regulator n=1 Tax=Candidatus Avisuccinivibrio stercorigallinarum TaxID=2840704 RepID=A0A9D9GTQ6_9GAMM|nr:sigma-54-dependent Fis family transcriptional regulator [Candidatus Avisuccinivibrio stercorigallinarum]